MRQATKNEEKAVAGPAIVVDRVTKAFTIPHEKRTTLFEKMVGIFGSPSYERYVALRDVSFTVQPGDFVGIVGENGSGKSTLLKVIANILRPTSGTVHAAGTITSFLELGVGFQMDLTARENIEVYSTIIGLSEKEIARNIGPVLEFAGLERFRDTKLKNFSSGMQVRLAFATAIQKVPDILLVDEVLAVGDMDFQHKCLDTFAEFKKKGVTIVFVSHDIGTVKRFCDKAILLKKGRMLAYGSTDEVIDRYIYGLGDDAAKAPEKISHSLPRKSRWGNGLITITGVSLKDKFGNENNNFCTGDPLTIRISFRARETIAQPVFGIGIYSESDQFLYGTNTAILNIDTGTVAGEGHVDIRIPCLSLLTGRYFLSVTSHTMDHVPYDWLDKHYSFTVVNIDRTDGIVDLKSEWEFFAERP